MKCLFIFLLAFISSSVIAQGWMPQGARSSGLGNTSVTLVDAFAYHHNPGALGYMEKGGAAISYESRFMIRELQSQGFAAVQPLNTGVISIGGQFYGYKNYRTNRVGAGYSLLLNENLSAGIQMNYLSLRLDDFYGVKHMATGEAGMLAKLGDDMTFGASVVNIGRARLSEFEDDRFSTILRIGAGYQITKELLFLLELEQEVTHKTRMRSGLEYTPNEKFYVRAGFQGAPIEFSFGTGFRFGPLQLDLASHYHQILGWTPMVSLIFDFHKSQDE